MNNLIILVGRLTKEVELRKTDSDMSVATFSVAVNRNFKNSNGEYATDFFNVQAFGKTADFINEYVHKGSLVGIKGRLQNNNYEKDGKTIYTNSIIVENINILSQPKTNEQSNEINEVEDDPFKDFETIDNNDYPF